MLDGDKKEVPEIQEPPSSQFEILEQPLSALVVQKSEEEKGLQFDG